MLIEVVEHNVLMFALILIPVVAVVALLVYALGADSRVDDVARRRGYTG